MKRNQYSSQSDNSEVLQPIVDDEHPTGIDKAPNGARKGEQHEARQCRRCGSGAVHPLGLIYASSTPTLAALSPYGVATPSLPLWVTAHAYPPEKMTTWTGFTLSLMVWPACLFLLGTALYAWWTTGSAARESPLIYLTAVVIGVAAWSIPALLRRREADQHNLNIWEPAMNKWRTNHMCLKCGKI